MLKTLEKGAMIMEEKKTFNNIKFGFNTRGLTVNGKEFHPLNWSTDKFALESDIPTNPVDAVELLETLATVNSEEATKQDKLGALKTMVGKVM